MKNVKKSLVAAAALAVVGSAGVIGAQAVLAETNNSNSDPMSSLVDKIASKFNLNKAEVQKVFAEERSTREAERQAKVSERLQKLVDDGTITAEQKAKIEAKIKELKEKREATRDSMKDLSPDQRKAKMDEKRTELEDWAKENGIDLSKLKGVLMGGHGHGPGGRAH